MSVHPALHLGERLLKKRPGIVIACRVLELKHPVRLPDRELQIAPSDAQAVAPNNKGAPGNQPGAPSGSYQELLLITWRQS